MPPRNEVVLVRHGETGWSRSGRHTGRTDLPLTEKGCQQARAVGALLAGRRFGRVLVSPLARARETARLAGYAGETEPDLSEWDYGDCEGRTERGTCVRGSHVGLRRLGFLVQRPLSYLALNRRKGGTTERERGANVQRFESNTRRLGSNARPSSRERD